MKVLLFLALFGAAAYGQNHVDVPISKYCNRLYPTSGLTSGFYENIAHAVHGMTVQGLQMFNRRVTVKNYVPTVNLNVSASQRVLPYAPDVPVGSDFVTYTMNGIDRILSNIGVSDDGLGPYWSAIERVAHSFHMQDLWQKIRIEYEGEVSWNPPTKDVCSCLTDVKNNGIYDAVDWVASHYKSGTPITLLNRPIPKLEDAKAWGVWKERLLHYYNKPAVHDAALYLYCATKDF